MAAVHPPLSAAFLLWLGCFGCMLAGKVCAQDLLLEERAGLRPGLCGTLRLQMSGLAEVRCEPESAGEALADRIASLAERVRDTRAQLGVLLERDPDPSRVRMYLVAGAADRAVIAIEAIEDRPDPDVDRSLALQARHAYETLGMVPAGAPLPLAASLVLGPSERGAGSRGAALSAKAWLMFLDAGGGVSVQAPGLHDGGVGAIAAFHLGAARLGPRLRLEAGLGAQLLSRREASAASGRVSLAERGPALTLRALWRSRRCELGAVFEAFASVIRAQGTSPRGAHGAATRVTPTLAFGPDLRLRLFDHAFLRFAPLFEALVFDRHFAVDHVGVTHTGSWRFSAMFSLLVGLPSAQGTAR
jgi:hypothetical protein